MKLISFDEFEQKFNEDFKGFKGKVIGNCKKCGANGVLVSDHKCEEKKDKKEKKEDKKD